MFLRKKFHAVILFFSIMCIFAASVSAGEYQPSEAPLSQEFLRYKPASGSSASYPGIVGGTSEPSAYQGGYVPSPVNRSHLKSNPPKKSAQSGIKGDIVIPSKYDLRNADSNNYLPAVRNQGQYGTCWAHAASEESSQTILDRALRS